MMIPLHIKQKIALGSLVLLSGLLLVAGADIVPLAVTVVGLELFLFVADDLVEIWRKPTRDIPLFTLCPLDWAFLFLFVVEVVGAAFSSDWLRSQLAANRILAMVLVYLLCRLYLKEGYLRNWFVHWLSLLGLVCALFVISAFVPFYWTMIDTGFTPPDIVPLRYLLVPHGLLINDWGSILLAFLPFNIYSVYVIRGKWKAIPALALFVVLLATVLTLSRGTLLALGLFVILFCVGLVIFRIVSWKRTLLWLGAYVLCLFLALLPLRQTLRATLNTDRQSSQGMSASGRIVRWEESFFLFARHPLTGIGNGNYALESMVISNRDGSAYTRRVNNIFVQLLLEKGLVGTVAYLVVFILVFRAAIGYFRRSAGNRFTVVVFGMGLIALLFREMTSSTLLEQPSCLLLSLFLILMLTLWEDKGPVRRPAAGRLAVLLAVGLFWALALTSEERVRKSGMANASGLNAMQKGQWADADRAFRRAAAITPRNAVLYANQALCRLAEAGLPFDPGSFAAGHSYATDSSRAMDDALLLFEQAVRLSPRDPVFLCNIGWIHIRQGRLAEAESCFRQTIELAPYEAVFSASLGMLVEHQGKAAYAVACYAQALAASPALLDTPFFADLVARRPELADSVIIGARLLLEQSLDGTKDYLAMARLARICYYAGDFEQTETLLHAVTAHVPNLNRPWLTLGQVATDPEVALSYYRKAQALDLSDPLPPYYIAQCYETLGDSVRAAEHYSVAVRNSTRFNYTAYGLRTPRIYQARIWKNEYYPAELLSWLTASPPPVPVGAVGK